MLSNPAPSDKSTRAPNPRPSDKSTRAPGPAPWDLDPTLLPLLRSIVDDAAAIGHGARLVVATPDRGPRVLVGIRGNHCSWRALSLTVLQRGEISSSADSIAAPIQATRGLRGALVLHGSSHGPPPGAELLVRAHAARIETALAQAATLLTTTRGTVEALLHSLAAHDADTARHAGIVRRLARVLGEVMGLAPYILQEVEWAALLHDVGKIAVPLSVLQKAGPLTAAEWTLMRQHPGSGERIVRAVPSLEAVGLAVRHHHERWDGTGYPDRLAGPAIPLHARLVALVDAYEVMRTGRPYRPALGQDEALGELHRNAGTQFDPALLALLPALAGHDPGAHG